MTCSNCRDALPDYVRGELDRTNQASVAKHLESCTACRAETELAERLRTATTSLPRQIVPDRDLWPELSRSIAHAPVSAEPIRRSAPAWLVPFAVAAAVAMLCTLSGRHVKRMSISAPATWSVASLAGTPRVESQPVAHETAFRVGDWLETDAASRAKVAIGSIGELRVEPNSRVRLVGAAALHHRIELTRGTIDALIWAPPRLFFVDTPSATAVDLGCAYTLTVDDAGNSELHVTAGYVALEHPDRDVVIPSGTKCVTRRHKGPGTPFYARSSVALQDALSRFDFGAAAERPLALAEILRSAAEDDEVTLWHLLSRTDGTDRVAVFESLQKLSALPAGLTRDAILRGDAAARRAWGTALGFGDFVTR